MVGYRAAFCVASFFLAISVVVQGFGNIVKCSGRIRAIRSSNYDDFAPGNRFPVENPSNRASDDYIESLRKRPDEYVDDPPVNRYERERAIQEATERQSRMMGQPNIDDYTKGSGFQSERYANMMSRLRSRTNVDPSYHDGRSDQLPANQKRQQHESAAEEELRKEINRNQPESAQPDDRVARILELRQRENERKEGEVKQGGRLTVEEKERILRETVERQQRLMATAKGFDPDTLDPSKLAKERAKSRVEMELKMNTILPSSAAADDYMNSLKAHTRKLADERTKGDFGPIRPDRVTREQRVEDQWSEDEAAVQSGKRYEAQSETKQSGQPASQPIGQASKLSSTYTERLREAKSEAPPTPKVMPIKPAFPRQSETSYTAELERLMERQRAKAAAATQSEVEDALRSPPLPSRPIKPQEVETLVENALNLLNEKVKYGIAKGLREALEETREALRLETLATQPISNHPIATESTHPVAEKAKIASTSPSRKSAVSDLHSTADLLKEHELKPFVGAKLLMLRNALVEVVKGIDRALDKQKPESLEVENFSDSPSSQIELKGQVREVVGRSRSNAERTLNLLRKVGVHQSNFAFNELSNDEIAAMIKGLQEVVSDMQKSSEI